MTTNPRIVDAPEASRERDLAAGRYPDGTVIASRELDGVRATVIAADPDGGGPRTLVFRGSRYAAPAGAGTVLVRKLDKLILEAIDDEAITPELRCHVGSLSRDRMDANPNLVAYSPTSKPRVGDVAWIWGFGAWRCGIVRDVARTRATVAYATRSGLGIWRPTARFDEIRHRAV